MKVREETFSISVRRVDLGLGVTKVVPAGSVERRGPLNARE